MQLKHPLLLSQALIILLSFSKLKCLVAQQVTLSLSSKCVTDFISSSLYQIKKQAYRKNNIHRGQCYLGLVSNTKINKL